MLFFAKTSGSCWASATVSGSSGQPGAREVYAFSSNNARQRSQLLERSHRPCTKTIGFNPDAFARSMSCCSWAVMVVMSFSLVSDTDGNGDVRLVYYSTY